MGGWSENEFLKKTLSLKFGIESQLGTSDLEFVKSFKLTSDFGQNQRKNSFKVFFKFGLESQLGTCDFEVSQ